MGIWLHDGKLYEVTSGYSLPDDAWEYELMGLTGPPGTGPYLTVMIPDATPDGPFTPRPAPDVMVRAGGGTVPWPILENLMSLLDSSGDLVDERRDLSAEATSLPLTLNVWSHGDRQYEVNHFYYSDIESWCYELYAADSELDNNGGIDVRIPDAATESDPLIPLPSSQVVMTIRGPWAIPWPVFRRFLDVIRAAGDIVEATADDTSPVDKQ